jgi:hypothetical protein
MTHGVRLVHRRLLHALLLGCALLGASVRPVAASPPDSATPVVVGERRFTSAELRAKLQPAPTKAQSRFSAATVLILGEWQVRQAQALGVVAPVAAVDAAMAEQTRQSEIVGPIYFAPDHSPEQRRIDLEDGIRSELITDAILRDVPTEPKAFGRAFDAAAAQQRAVTSCLAKYADPTLDLCGNRPKHADSCATMGLVDICGEFFPHSRRWTVASNVWRDFYDPPAAFQEPDPKSGFERVLRYIHAHAPAARGCFWETDDAWLEFICSTRAQAIAVAYAITRVHMKAKQGWSVPATYGHL